MSVSWQYRPDSVENWFKLVYELKSWIEKKTRIERIYFTDWIFAYFAAFLTEKWNICSIKNLCGLSERFLRNMEAIRWGERLLQSWQTEGKLQITQKLWKIMIRTFSLGMKWRWYLLMSVGIKILVSCRVDERLSDTGIRKSKDSGSWSGVTVFKNMD